MAQPAPFLLQTRALLAFIYVATTLVVCWVAFSQRRVPNELADTIHDGQPCMAIFSAYDLMRTIFYVWSVVWAVAATRLLQAAETPHVWQAAVYSVLNWAAATASAAETLTSDCSPSDGFYFAAYPLFSVVATGITMIVLVMSMNLATSRAESLEMHALRSFGGWRLRWGQRGMLAVTVPSFSTLQLARHPFFGAAWVQLLMLVCGVAYALVMLLWPCLGAVLLCNVAGQVKKAERSSLPWMAAMVRKARGSLRIEVLLLSLALSGTFVRFLYVVLATTTTTVSSIALNNSATLLDNIGNLVCALGLSGALTCSGSGPAGRARLVRQRRARWAAARQAWLQHSKEPEMGAWHGKVADLAHRGVCLEKILEFYACLPGAMSFEPGQHTTGDVVHQVIIPYSEAKACHAAELLMNGKQVRPDRMVTHAWSNLFRDLVSALVADAFEEGEYGLYARMLDEDMPTLKAWVRNAGLGSRTYWVCIFAVNQHLGICSTNHTELDTVTGLPCPPCSCGLPKVWSDTPPLLADGRSVMCEMNKFDDMMRSLSAANPEYSQVVAIDTNFLTFSRAWCIAEMATAKDMGMAQAIKIGAAEELDASKDKLRVLRIQDMKASRERDREMILESIKDHDAFNSALQSLIWDELLPAWNSLDAQERMAAVGKVLKWQDSHVFKVPQREGLEELGPPVTTPDPQPQEPALNQPAMMSPRSSRVARATL